MNDQIPAWVGLTVVGTLVVLVLAGFLYLHYKLFESAGDDD